MNPSLHENDFVAILKVHTLAKAFVANVYKAAVSTVKLKPVHRTKAGRKYEYVKGKYYADLLDKNTAIDYILDPNTRFEAWCDSARYIDSRSITYQELVNEVASIKRTSASELTSAADYFITDCYTKLFKKSKITNWQKESRRLSAAISFLYGRYNIERAANAYMVFFEQDGKCELRTDMCYLLKHTSFDQAIIEKATRQAWLLLEEFSEYVDAHNQEHHLRYTR